jgi:mannitol-1-phosphate 5-dehydrogenase
LKGHRLLSDAANDQEIAALARRAGEESSAALCQRFHFDPEDQRQFAAAALAKYQKTEIVDPIERNARDPLRKLSRNDRLVGPAALALEYGIEPRSLSEGIAAALHYNNPNDPAAVQLQDLIRRKGVDGALREVCGIEPTGRLGRMIAAHYEQLAHRPERVS